jgi:hypothetical protein
MTPEIAAYDCSNRHCITLTCFDALEIIQGDRAVAAVQEPG